MFVKTVRSRSARLNSLSSGLGGAESRGELRVGARLEAQLGARDSARLGDCLDTYLSTKLGVGLGIGSSSLSLERKTERAFVLAQAGGPAQLYSSPSLARNAAQLVDLLGLTRVWLEARS